MNAAIGAGLGAVCPDPRFGHPRTTRVKAQQLRIIGLGDIGQILLPDHSAGPVREARDSLGIVGLIRHAKYRTAPSSQVAGSLHGNQPTGPRPAAERPKAPSPVAKQRDAVMIKRIVGYVRKGAIAELIKQKMDRFPCCGASGKSTNLLRNPMDHDGNRDEKPRPLLHPRDRRSDHDVPLVGVRFKGRRKQQNGYPRQPGDDDGQPVGYRATVADRMTLPEYSHAEE